jgi:hypothetical protein
LSQFPRGLDFSPAIKRNDFRVPAKTERGRLSCSSILCGALFLRHEVTIRSPCAETTTVCPSVSDVASAAKIICRILIKFGVCVPYKFPNKYSYFARRFSDSVLFSISAHYTAQGRRQCTYRDSVQFADCGRTATERHGVMSSHGDTVTGGQT